MKNIISTYRKFHFLFLLLFFLTGIHSDLTAQLLNIQTYSTSEGLPDIQLIDVAQDSSGLLWFVSIKGIISYDGEIWQLYRSGSDYRKMTSYQGKIIVDRFNTLWIMPERTSSPIISYDKEHFRSLPPLPETTKRVVYSDFMVLDEDTVIEVLASAENGILYRYKQGRWKTAYKTGNPGRDKIVKLEKNGDSVYIFTEKEILLYSITTGITDTITILPSHLKPVIAADRDNFRPNTLWLLGEDWYGSFTEGTFRITGKNIKIPFYEAQMHNFIKGVMGDRLFFGNRSRFFLANKSTGDYHECNPDKGYITDGASNVMVDREQNIWITTIRGINKIQQTPFVHYYEKNGLLENEVTAIEMFDDGTLVFGHNTGLTFLKDNTFTTKPFIIDYKKNARVLEMRKDSSNRIWLANAQYGIGLLSRNGSLTFYPVKNKGQLCNTVYYDNKDTVWYGLGSGFYYFLLSDPSRHYRETVTVFTRKIIPLSDGALMLCTTNGIYIRKDGLFRHYKCGHAHHNNIFNAYEKQDGSIIVASLGGTYTFKRSGEYIYSDQELGNSVFFVVEQDSGVFWYGTDRGVVQQKGNIKNYYSKAEGFSGNETNRSACLIDPEGNIWIGTDDGLSVYKKQYDLQSEIKPLARFRAIEFNDNERYDITVNREIPFDKNSFTLLYSGLSFINEKTHYYNIVLSSAAGKELEYFQVKENKFHIFNLQPGEYLFRLQMINSKGIESGWIQSGVISILPPFYQTTWFYVFSAFLFIGILAGIYRMLIGRQYTKTLEKEVEKRTDEIQRSRRELQNLNRNLEGMVDSKTAEISALIKQAPNGIVIYSKEGSIVGYNDKLLEIFKITDIESLISEYNVFRHRLFLDKENKEKLLAIFKKGGSFRTPPVFINKLQTPHTKIIEDLWLVIRFYSISDPGGSIFRVVGLFEDVTDQIKNLEMQRKLEERRLRSQVIIKATEEERERIARDLHDEFGQYISGAKYYLEAYLLKTDRQFDEIEKALNLVIRSGNELRNIIYDLYPQDIITFGLIDSIEMYCEKLDEEKPFSVIFQKDCEKLELPKNLEMPVYRIFKESVTNIIKHASCKTIIISLSLDENEFLLTIKDDGIGFTLDKNGMPAIQKQSFGLSNMYERAELLGASLNIDSTPGKGTEITLRLKIDSKEANDD